MGYELHITRGDRRGDTRGADGRDISLAEWLRCVASDPELWPDPDGPEGLALWSGHPAGARRWLAWFDGEVYSEGPDRPLVEKMLQLAARLGARVQGDDGERYEDAAAFAG